VERELSRSSFIATRFVLSGKSIPQVVRENEGVTEFLSRSPRERKALTNKDLYAALRALPLIAL